MDVCCSSLVKCLGCVINDNTRTREWSNLFTCRTFLFYNLSPVSLQCSPHARTSLVCTVWEHRKGLSQWSWMPEKDQGGCPHATQQADQRNYTVAQTHCASWCTHELSPLWVLSGHRLERERGSIQVRLWAYLFIYQHKSIISSPDDGINTNNRKRYSDWINITPYRVTVTALDENN